MRILAASILLAVTLACGGGASIQDLQTADQPRPPFGSLNLVLQDQTNGNSSRQLYLDRGNQAYPTQYPLAVSNDQDLQKVVLWRYDFVEVAPSSAANTLYATVLVRVDDTAASGFVSFWGRAGSYPVNPYLLSPDSLFGTQNIPDTPANHKATAVFVYLRQGNPVFLASPGTLGPIGPYRVLSDTSTVATSLPGMDFPVGGVTLTTTAGLTSVAGNVDPITNINAASSSSGTSGSSGSSSGGTSDTSGISTPATTVDDQRVPITSTISPVTSQFDLLFAWQPAALGVTLTHGVYADPTLVPDPYASGSAAFTGGGFFLTTLPGIPSVANGINTLDWTVLRSSTDSAWVLGWSAEVAATQSIQAGQNGALFNTLPSGSGMVNAEVRGYLSGLMSPTAQATQFQGQQDKNLVGGGNAVLYQGTMLPLLARSSSSALQAKLGQLLVAGRTLWYRQNSTLLGADVPASDQSLVDRYGTTLSFSAYLPVK